MWYVLTNVYTYLYKSSGDFCVQVLLLLCVCITLIIGGEDFIPGRYNVTFTTGANAANTSIPIIVNSTNDNETRQFGLNLYIDGIGYQLCLDKGDISKATVSISRKVSVT